MSVDKGSRFGQYVTSARIASRGSGEWFEASEEGLERSVSILVAPLPDDLGARAELRERARRLAGASDARLLPVYGQGEDEHNVWLATRRISGRSLAEIDRLDGRRAAALGAQLAAQLDALQEAGIAPASLTAEEVVVEEDGENERAWLLPDPQRPSGDDASAATQSVVDLLGERLGHPLVTDVPSDPRALGELLVRRATGRSRQRTLLLGICTAVALVLAAALAVDLTRRGGDSGAENAPAASIAARIPVAATITGLAASDRSVWIATQAGTLVKVDPKTERVVGTPLELFPKDAYLAAAFRDDVLWIGGPGKIVRLDGSTGRVLGTKRIGSRSVSGFLDSGVGVWTTLNEGQEEEAQLVRLDTTAQHEHTLGTPFGVYPVPVRATEDGVWAISGDGSFSKLDSKGHQTTIALGVQTGYATDARGHIWIPTRIDRTVVAVDPDAMEPESTFHLDGAPQRVVAGAGSIWVLTTNPSQIHRIDPVAMRLVGTPVAAPLDASSIAFGAGSIWVDDPKTRALVRLAPTAPAPALQPGEDVGAVLRNGPVPPKVRLRVQGARGPKFSIVAPDDEWVAEGVTEASVQIEALRHHGTGVSFATPKQVFNTAGRLVPVRSAAQFLSVLKQNPELAVSDVRPVTVGGLRGFRARIASNPMRSSPAFCPGPCVVVFPIERGTFILTGGIDEFTFVKRGRALFFVDASFGETVDPQLAARIRQIVASIRFG